MSNSPGLPEISFNDIPEWRRAATPSLPPNSVKSQKLWKKRTQLEPKDLGVHFSPQGITIGLQKRSTSVEKTRPTPETSLDSLGSDIWFLISSYISRSSLISLCQTSPHLYSILIPILYNTVDLSVHAPPDGVTISFSYRRQTCEKQCMFLRQTLRKPELGKHVRSLKWTLGLDCEKLGIGSKYPQGEKVMWRTGMREDVFECLDKVVNLDIDSVTEEGELVGEGENLFPDVQCVHLVGFHEPSFRIEWKLPKFGTSIISSKTDHKNFSAAPHLRRRFYMASAKLLYPFCT